MNSKDRSLNIQAYDFKLLSVDGSFKTLNDCMGEKGLVIAFICNHCPYVIAIQSRLIKLYHDLQDHGVNLIAINSNDAITYPDDSYKNMQITAREKIYPFDYLVDESQEIAKIYDVICTPEFFGLNSKAEIRYHGRLDAGGKSATSDTKRDLYLAMIDIATTEDCSQEQFPSKGCSIKWKI